VSAQSRGRTRAPARAAILAVDGGNSKADLALVATDGTLLAALRSPSISHQAVGLEAGMRTLRESAARLADMARLPAKQRAAIAETGVFALAGADFPEDVRLLRRAIESAGITTATDVINDTFGALRAGTERPWGVVLICGQGINAAAIAPDRRRARFDSIGEYSGDWGGARSLGDAALAAAVRAGDGRGESTTLERLVPAHFNVATAAALSKALYLERIPGHRLAELSPVVFSAAGQGDAVARSILDRLADELAVMAGALLRRLRMTRLDPEIVLAGGVFRTRDEAFFTRLEHGIRAVARNARPVRLEAPPVLGAALLGLDRMAPSGFTDPAAATRLRAELVAWDAGARREKANPG
jgi:N-acetylglucosamine kinase-like BadF-type ATPase